MPEQTILRLILGYQDTWFAHFPHLSRRAEWHILHHLATKGRSGAPAGELYGLVKQVFLLDDATVKERLMAISQMGFCQLDPPGQVLARSVATPTPDFLNRFDAHLAAFSRVLADLAGNPGIAQTEVVSPLWRSQVLRPLEIYSDCWLSATDALFEHTGLSPARRSDARRHLISSSHWNLIHTAFHWHYGSGPDPAAILADRLAAKLLELTGQTVQTTKDHIGYLVQLGIFQRMRGRALHVAPSDIGLHYIGIALQQTASALPPLFAVLSETVPAQALGGANVEDDAERTLNIRPGMEQHVLEVVSPTSRAQRFEITPPLTIGRAPPSEVVLARSDVSRVHCRIERVGARFILSDLNSTNGTFVNDRRIGSPTHLKVGDRLRIGSFTLLYDIDASGLDRTQRVSADEIVAIAQADGNKSGNSAG